MSAAYPNNSITLTIDGREVTCPSGTTILEAAAAIGIDIPSLCAHPTLKPFGRCRLCLVEVEGLRGYPSACTTPAADEMVVTTESEALARLRRDALELVLTEHPTGCLMCGHQDACIDEHGCHSRRSGTVTGCRFCPMDQQCELQDMVERLGVTDMTLPVKYRGLPVDRRDPFFDRDYNLCILCARCVRVCDERRGAGAVALTFRGAEALVGTAYNRPLLATECQFCGACVDVCPTASLAERVNKWVGVPDGGVETTCPFCALGCALELRTLEGQVIGARPVGDGELCSKGRFAPVEVSLADSRVLRPEVRRDGRLVKVEWDEALAAAAAGLAAAETRAVYASRDLLSEDLEAILRLAREVLGTPGVESDAWMAGADTIEATASLDDLVDADVILSVRTDLRYTHTPVQLAIQRAAGRGATVIGLEPFPNDLRRRAAIWLPVRAGSEARLLEALRTPGDALADDAPLQAAAEALHGDGAKVIVWGSPLTQQSTGGAAVEAILALAEETGAKVLPLLDGANTRGVWEAGGRPGRDSVLARLLDGEGGGALISFGRPPFAARPRGAFWIAYVDTADEVVAEADVILPATVFTEQSGMTIDLFGRRRRFVAAVEPAGEARPAAWVCGELAARMAAAKPPAATTPTPDADQTVAAVEAGPEDLLLVREYSRFGYLGSSLAQRVPGMIPLAREGLVQINPADALRLRLRERDEVKVEGPRGAIISRATVTAATPQGTLRLVLSPTEEPLPDGAPLAAVLGPNPARVTLTRLEGVAVEEGERVDV